MLYVFGNSKAQFDSWKIQHPAFSSCICYVTEPRDLYGYRPIDSDKYILIGEFWDNPFLEEFIYRMKVGGAKKLTSE